MDSTGAIHPAAIADRLSREIIRGEYRPGVPIRQDALAQRFGVSRTPVREALRMLQERGLVERDGRRGVRIHLASPDEYDQLFLVCAELEGFAAELATQRLRRPQLREIEDSHARFIEAVRAYTEAPHDDLERLSEVFTEEVRATNEHFHEAILSAADCPPLTETVTRLRRRVPPELAWLAARHEEGLASDSIEDHEAIVQAIRDRDAAAARQALMNHVLDAGATIIWWVSGEPRPRKLEDPSIRPGRAERLTPSG